MDLPIEIQSHILAYIPEYQIAARTCVRFRDICYSHLVVTMDMLCLAANRSQESFIHLIQRVKKISQQDLESLLDILCRNFYKDCVPYVIALMDDPNVLLHAKQVYMDCVYLALLKCPGVDYAAFCVRAYKNADEHGCEYPLYVCVWDDRYNPHVYGWFGISYLIKNGHYRYAKKVIDNEWEIPTRVVETIIRECIEKNRFRILDLWLSAGLRARIDNDAVIDACKQGYSLVISSLIRHGLLKDEITQIFFTAIEYGRLDLVTMTRPLITTHIDINTGFSNAVYMGFQDIALYLLKSGAKFIAHDCFEAINNGFTDLVEEMRSRQPESVLGAEKMY